MHATVHSAFVALSLSSLLFAQTYTVDYGAETPMGAGFHKALPEANYHPISSPVVAHTAGYPYRGGGNEPYAYGEARAAQHQLYAYGFGTSAISNMIRGMGLATWEFTDVVFSDGGTTPQTIQVQLQFEVWGERTGTTPIPTGDGYFLSVYVAQASGAGSQTWGTAGSGVQLIPTPAPQIVRSGNGTSGPGAGSMAVQTNTPLVVRVSLMSVGLGYNTWQAGIGSVYSTCETHLTWAPTPFVLPPGVTVDSPQAGIVGNTRTTTPPDIMPLVGASLPVQATNPDFDVNFYRGEPGSLGIFMFGGVPVQNQVPIADSFALGLPWVPITTSVFLADGNGRATFTMPLYPALAGLPLGIQVAQLAGAQPKAYGSNALLVVVQ